MSLTTEQARAAVLKSWANTTDNKARTKPARDAHKAAAVARRAAKAAAEAQAQNTAEQK